jgi:hypothetical protein
MTHTLTPLCPKGQDGPTISYRLRETTVKRPGCRRSTPAPVFTMSLHSRQASLPISRIPVYSYSTADPCTWPKRRGMVQFAEACRPTFFAREKLAGHRPSAAWGVFRKQPAADHPGSTSHLPEVEGAHGGWGRGGPTGEGALRVATREGYRYGWKRRALTIAISGWPRRPRPPLLILR